MLEYRGYFISDFVGTVYDRDGESVILFHRPFSATKDEGRELGKKEIDETLDARTDRTTT